MLTVKIYTVNTGINGIRIFSPVYRYSRLFYAGILVFRTVSNGKPESDIIFYGIPVYRYERYTAGKPKREEWRGKERSFNVKKA